MNSFGTKSVLWIEDLTTFKESVLFAHTLLLHCCTEVILILNKANTYKSRAGHK